MRAAAFDINYDRITMFSSATLSDCILLAKFRNPIDFTCLDVIFTVLWLCWF